MQAGHLLVAGEGIVGPLGAAKGGGLAGQDEDFLALMRAGGGFEDDLHWDTRLSFASAQREDSPAGTANGRVFVTDEFRQPRYLHVARAARVQNFQGGGGYGRRGGPRESCQLFVDALHSQPTEGFADPGKLPLLGIGKGRKHHAAVFLAADAQKDGGRGKGHRSVVASQAGGQNRQAVLRAQHQAVQMGLNPLIQLAEIADPPGRIAQCSPPHLPKHLQFLEVFLQDALQVGLSAGHYRRVISVIAGVSVRV